MQLIITNAHAVLKDRLLEHATLFIKDGIIETSLLKRR